MCEVRNMNKKKQNKTKNPRNGIRCVFAFLVCDCEYNIMNLCQSFCVFLCSAI